MLLRGGSRKWGRWHLGYGLLLVPFTLQCTCSARRQLLSKAVDEPAVSVTEGDIDYEMLQRQLIELEEAPGAMVERFACPPGKYQNASEHTRKNELLRAWQIMLEGEGYLPEVSAQ